MKSRDIEIIRAVYHEDVEIFFEYLNLSKELAEGKIHCMICNETITIDNFRALIKKTNKLLFCCNKEFCIQSFNPYSESEEK
jgi:hypothetical protein